MSAVAVSVVIPAWNAAGTIGRVLGGLAADREYPAEVIVVDDGSTDGTAECVLAHRAAAGGDIRLVRQPHRGAAAARNAGAARARAPLLLFLGADIVPVSPLVTRHVLVHRQYPAEHVGCLGFVTWDPGLPPTPFMVFLEHGGPQNAYGEIAGESWVPPRRFFYGANVSLKRALFERAGGFDARTFCEYGWEDLELGTRLAAVGFQLAYEPRAQGVHAHRLRLTEVEARMRTLGQSAWGFHALHPEVRVLRPARERVLRPFRALVFSTVVRWALRQAALRCEHRVIVPALYHRVLRLAFTDGVHRGRPKGPVLGCG